MTWLMIPKVMIGNRAAIMEAASRRSTLLVGALLVLSASLARKYDTVDLMSEPLELLHGFGATVVNAFVLHLMMWWVGNGGQRPRFWSSYLAFLGVFWLSSPLGWLYGIPYEQFLTPSGAVRANLNTLALVSLVRVVWVTRVLNVLWGVGGGWKGVGTFFVVMLYADAVAIVALKAMPMPTLDVMGGLQRTAVERVLTDAAWSAMILAVLSAPVWVIGGVIVLGKGGKVWSVADRPESAAAKSRGAMCIAIASVVLWVPALLMQQPVQRRTSIERDMAAGRVREAVHRLCTRPRSDYPPVWEPPPLPQGWASDEELALLGKVVEALNAEPSVPEWVSETYSRKAERFLTVRLGCYPSSILSCEPAMAASRRETAVERAHIRRCLRFVQERMPGLTDAQRKVLEAWIVEVDGWKE